jgi:hypothetical protein
MHSFRLLVTAVPLLLAACDGRSGPSNPDDAGTPDSSIDGSGPGSCSGTDCTDLYVATTGTGTTCTMASPCKNIQAAIDLHTATRNIIHIAAGAYVESLVIRGGAPVTLLGDHVDVSPSRDTSVVTIEGDLDVTLVGLDLHGGKGRVSDASETNGIACVINGTREPKLTLQRVAIHDNAGIGIRLSRCQLVLERSMIRNNHKGGVLTTTGFEVRNTFIVDNGADGDFGSHGGLDVIGSAAVSSVFEFNTVANNRSIAAGTGVNVGASTAHFTSNIVFGNAPVTGTGNEVFGGRWSHSMFGGNTVPLDVDPSNNTNVAKDPKFQGATDYHLASGSPAIDQGDPQSTLAIDWDGDARPIGPRRDIGADEAPAP